MLRTEIGTKLVLASIFTAGGLLLVTGVQGALDPGTVLAGLGEPGYGVAAAYGIAAVLCACGLVCQGVAVRLYVAFGFDAWRVDDRPLGPDDLGE